jgi:hypothetical protein
VQIDDKWLSARADRRQAALQRQDREREEQQWFVVTASNIPTTFTASAIAAPAIVTAVVTTTILTAVPIISTAFTAFAVTTAVTAVAVTAVTITAIACAPTAISTAVFTAVTSSISIDFTAFAASAIVYFPSIPRTLGPRKLSARADRRLAALQRQEREREEQQWVEQLRKREPKASGNKRAALRYLTREIGTWFSAEVFDISLERSEPWFSAEVERFLEVERRLM